jgi:hypothetical protein
LAGKVQPKVGNGVAQMSRRRIISGSAEIFAISAVRLDHRASSKKPGSDSGIKPELRLPAPQLRRE